MQRDKKLNIFIYSVHRMRGMTIHNDLMEWMKYERRGWNFFGGN